VTIAGGPFYLGPSGGRPDPTDDDLALWIETTRGLVALSNAFPGRVIQGTTGLRLTF